MKPIRLNQPSAPRAKAYAFTLVEVLVAVFIVAITFAASLRGLTELSQSSHDIDQRTLALWAADNILLEQRIEQRPLVVGEDKRDCPQGPFAFRCVITVNPTPNPNFFRVLVQVQLGESQQNLVQLVHVVLKPGAI